MKIFRNRQKGDIVRLIIFIVAVCGFLASGIYLVIRFKNAQDATSRNSSITDIVIETKAPSNVADNGDNAEDLHSIEINGTKYYGINAALTVNMDALREINSEAVGWIHVPQCNISYPLAQTTDNDKYLVTDFSGSESYSGAIFLDKSNAPDFSGAHTVIYGHHMTDGSMFANLLKYDDESFYKECEEDNNNYIYIYNDSGVLVYEIFCVCDVNIDDHTTAFYPNFFTGLTEVDYAEYVKSQALYDIDVDVVEGDRILTLFTCQGTSAEKTRHMVHAKYLTTLND